MVSVYNREATLQRCVDSILRQSYNNLEIILVDDGSQDASPRLCDECAVRDSRIKVVHKENGGVSSARNAGIHAATGHYITFVDSDDILGDAYIEQLYTVMQEYNAQLTIGGFTYCYADQEQKRSIGSQTVFENKNAFLESFGFLYENFFINSVCNKLFIRNKITKGFTENLSLGEDCLFVLDYLRGVERIALADTTGYFYQMETANSLTKEIRKDAFEITKRLYLSLLEYLDGFEGAVHSLQKVFLDDVSKYIREVTLAKNISKAEKQNRYSVVSGDIEFQKALQCSKIGTGQRKIFDWLVSKKYRLMETVLMIKYGILFRFLKK